MRNLISLLLDFEANINAETFDTIFGVDGFKLYSDFILKYKNSFLMLYRHLSEKQVNLLINYLNS